MARARNYDVATGLNHIGVESISSHGFEGVDSELVFQAIDACIDLGGRHLQHPFGIVVLTAVIGCIQILYNFLDEIGIAFWKIESASLALEEAALHNAGKEI